jgi:Ni,Fe-hydrogenase I small subunit
MHGSSMPPMLSPMSQSTIANLALIPVIDVSQCPVNHAKAIKVSVLCISHLTQSKVIAIGIDSFNSPIAFFCDQDVKAFHLLPIDNS